MFIVQAKAMSQRQIFSSPPSDITSSSDQKPVQPNPVTFFCPSKKMGQQNRSFNPKWFNTYNWLEYSIERDAAFAFHVAILTQKVVEMKMCSQKMASVTGGMHLV